jgi:glycosyltransferase involved in cell wall biosynthesis
VLAKVLHDDLNAGGGSERLALTTIELLNEMGFEVDVQTCKVPDIKKLEKNFGQLNIKIRKVKKLDLLSLLLRQTSEEDGRHVSDDCQYDLIINIHGDLLPYFYENHKENNDNATYLNTSTDDQNAHYIRTRRTSLMLTYCHYPLVPYQTKNGDYKRFLNKFIKFDNGPAAYFALAPASHLSIMDKLLSNANSLYDLMISNTIVLTNSEFSKRAIKYIYNKEALILSPPVNVEAFQKVALYSNKGQRENIILVVSRFSSDKQIENAIEVAKMLYEKREAKFRMIIVGNVYRTDMDYLQFIRAMIEDNDLNKYVRLEVGVSFDQLLHLMSISKVYLHPLAGEPFGISVAEAMAAGLVPVVPHIGGNSEFVPEKYHYSKLEQASEIIRNVLFSSSFNDDTFNNNITRNKTTTITTSHITNITEHELRLKLSNLVIKFSTRNFKNNLKRIIDTLMTEKDMQMVEEATENRAPIVYRST